MNGETYLLLITKKQTIYLKKKKKEITDLLDSKSVEIAKNIYIYLSFRFQESHLKTFGVRNSFGQRVSRPLTCIVETPKTRQASI